MMYVYSKGKVFIHAYISVVPVPLYKKGLKFRAIFKMGRSMRLVHEGFIIGIPHEGATHNCIFFSF